MKYKVTLRRTDEGYSVPVPGLPGCWSEGDSEREARESIEDAMREYLAVVAEARDKARGSGATRRSLVRTLRKVRGPGS